MISDYPLITAHVDVQHHIVLLCARCQLPYRLTKTMLGDPLFLTVYRSTAGKQHG